MKAVEQFRIHAAAAWRSRRARSGGEPLPAHLVLRLDGFDAPAPTPASTLALADWHARIVSVLEVTRPLPVRVIAEAGNPLLAEVARFAWRLECPVTVRTGPGIDRHIAEALVDAGVRRIVVVAALEADVVALVAARLSRNARLDVVVEIPFRVGVDPVAATEALRAAGADGAWVGAPWRSGPTGAAGAIAGWHASFHRTPATVMAALSRFDGGVGVPRTRGVCPVGGLRVELGPDGTWSQCPFHPGATTALEFVAAWPALASHRSTIRTCTRACVHAELAPGDPGATP